MKPRDRAATEAAILAAARSLIAAEGFASFGVNALAAAAGCDKKLIYRYFDGLDGVLDALGRDPETWGLTPAAPLSGSYADRLKQALALYRAAVARDVIVRRLLAWELVGAAPDLGPLRRARSQAAQAWLAGLIGDARPTDPASSAAANAVALAAVHYLALKADTEGGFAGLTLDEAGWARIEAALHALIDAAAA